MAPGKCRLSPSVGRGEDPLSPIFADYKNIIRRETHLPMYPIGYLAVAAAKLLDLVLVLYLWIILARVILSWIRVDQYNPVIRFIHTVTEPVLSKVRSQIPVSFGGIDFSPMLILLAIFFLRLFLVQTLLRFGNSLL